VRFVAADEAQATPTASVDAIVAVAQLVRAQIDAEEAAAQGRFDDARDVMVRFQRAAISRGHASVGDAAGKLASRVATREAYATSTAYRSSMRKGSSRGVSSMYDAAAEADLHAMGRARKTVAQDRMEQVFGAKGDAGKTPPTGGGIARRRSKRW
jgi:hypothetical protein